MMRDGLPMGDVRAIAPCRFVCAACGKTSSTKYGFGGTANPGWDTSCMLNSVLCAPAEQPPPPWDAVENPREGVHYERVIE
jgi:hypothetical protein